MFWFKEIKWHQQILTLNLNTSYVLVQDANSAVDKAPVPDLNTSYVLVQGVEIYEGDIIHRFKYIICFGSRILWHQGESDAGKFKYIICFGSRKVISMAIKIIPI